MTRILAALSQVAADYDVLYCDLWGCLHDGKAPFPDAVAALRSFRAGGGKVLLLTNAPRPKPSVLNQLNRIGVPADCYDDLVSSGDAAQYGLVTGAAGRRLHHVGPDKDKVFFTELSDDVRMIAATEPPFTLVPLDQAEGLVVTGLIDDMTETPDDYRATLLYAKTKGMKLLCANPDIVVDLGDQRLYCAGALAQAYDQMGGRSLYFGKPHPPIYDLARRRTAALPGVPDDPRILAIGDGIGTDIQGAGGEEIDALFVTGGISAASFGPDADHPDPGPLQNWLEDQQLDPAYAIGKLR
jgi:HAD superfamily hydrolase (TIGR01459 family)